MKDNQTMVACTECGVVALRGTGYHSGEDRCCIVRNDNQCIGTLNDVRNDDGQLEFVSLDGPSADDTQVIAPDGKELESERTFYTPLPPIYGHGKMRLTVHLVDGKIRIFVSFLTDSPGVSWITLSRSEVADVFRLLLNAKQ